MIITGLLNVVVSVFTGFVSLLPTIPPFPPEIVSFFSTVQSAIVSGCAILANYCYWNIVVSMLGITITVYLAYHGYQFILFVIKKIPLLGIE